MDAAAILDIYEESYDEAIGRGIDQDTARKEAITAAAMMLSAMDGVEDAAARNQVEGLISEHA